MSFEPLLYPVVMVPDTELGGFVAQVFDVPYAMAQGDTRDEALQEVLLALDDVLASNFFEHEARRSVPLPSRADNLTLDEIAPKEGALQGDVQDYLAFLALPEALSRKIHDHNKKVALE